MTDKTKFRPVTGTDAQIEMTPKTPGWVYFAEDTGKIYYDKDIETRVTMGGSGVAIHYGNAQANLEPDPDYNDFYILTKDDLQSQDAVVAVDDLIFNSDGTFYRVKEIEGKYFYCTKVAVAGGGGGGGNLPSNIKSSTKVVFETPKTLNIINGQELILQFTAYSLVTVDGTPEGSVEDDFMTISWYLAEQVGDNYITYHNGTSFMANHGVLTDLSIGEFLRPSTTTRVFLKASGINSGDTKIYTLDFSTSELTLTENSSFSPMTVYDKDNLIVWCNVSGKMNKILEYYFDDELVHTERLSDNNAEAAQSFQIPSNLCTHGYHKIRVELYQAIGAYLQTAEKGLPVPPLEYEVAVKNAGNNKPIIWLGQYQKEYYNYDDIKIPYLVYDPESAETTTVYLWKNGLPTASPERQVPSSSYKKWNDFEIVDADLDKVNYYSISCGTGERKEERAINFTVVKDPVRKMELVKQDYLQLLFDAKGRSNAESSTNRSNWSYTKKDGSQIKAEFIDFNWYNNGWTADEIGNSCLRISNGAQFKIPVGTTTFASGTALTQSHSYEFQFKVRNVQDYSELIKNITRYKNDDSFWTAFNSQTKYDNYDAFLQYYLPIYQLKEDETEENRVKYDDLKFDSVYKKINLSKVVGSYFSGNESNATGFCLGSQDAFFSNGQSTVNVSYVEDQMVYLTIVYDHQPKAISRIYIYINGVLTGAIQTNGKEFIINSSDIIFNSEYCDIDLYKMRIYSTALSVNDIVMNHAVDKKDIHTYDLNGLAIENNSIGEYQLDFQKMLDYNNANPNKYIMPYIVFDTSKSNKNDRLPWSKAVEIPCSVTFKNTGLDRAYATGELLELAIKDGLCTEKSTAKEQEEAVKKYYLHHCPSFTGENWEITVQGTSSQFYPRRNYKIKAKTEFDDDKVERTHIWLNSGPFATDFIVNGMTPNVEEDEDDPSIVPYTNPCHTDWFYMDNYDVGTNRFTMKIDYMESSGSYNGGFANLVANAYTKHPLDDYIGEEKILDPENKLNTRDLRTSVQGYPVLAFHKKSDGSYTYIGRYNMLLDKGSDECYGFKPDKKVLAKMFTEVNDKGETVNRRLRDVAECWEYSNNARGYCSFRDPWMRKTLSFRPPTGTPGISGNGMTPNGAPLVADSFEYRYHEQEDGLDIIYKLSEATHSEFKELKVANAVEAAEKMYEWYANWERACQWVWSTCIDDDVCDKLKVPNQGTYTKIKVGKKLWKSGEFYILDPNTSQYIIDNSDEWDENITYYDQKTVTENGEFVRYDYVNAYASKFIYAPGAYYTTTDEITYIVDRNDTMNETVQYWKLEWFSDEVLTEMAAAGEVEALPNPVTYGNNTYKYDTREYRVDKFVYELEDHFDIDYLATYFVMTEVFECYDSRGKNCMMASWGPLHEGGDYIWYPIFYDIDTQLGINNTGIPSFEYSVDATEAGNFSTSDSVLWNNFYKNFRNSYILQKYRQLKGFTEGIGGFEALKIPILDSVNRIEKWYQADPEETGMIAMRGQRPLIAINLDEYYKYLTIYNGAGIVDNPADNWKSTTGRINDSGQYVTETTDYLYALQGDRSLSRIQFLTNRIEYIDSWLNVGNYARGGYNRLWGRVAANNSNISDFWLDTVEDPYYINEETKEKAHEFDAEYWMILTPIHDSYITLSDDNEAYPSQKFTGSPVKFEIAALENGFRRSQGYPEQLLYVYGMNQMRDIGDLSKLYWTEFKIEGEAKKLTRLKLGHDGYMTDNEGNYVNVNGDIITREQLATEGVTWFNNKMNPPSFPSSKNQSGMPLLKEMNVCNININPGAGGTPSLDLTSCEKLENFRATGSNFEEVQFAEGVALNTLYLPRSVKELSLTEAKLLNNIIETYHYPEKDDTGNLVAERGLYIEGLTDATEEDLKPENRVTIPLTTINIVGDAFGYDSYKLLTKFFKRRYGKTGTDISKVTLTNVNWSPYEKLVEGDVYIAADHDLYFIDNGHYGLRGLTTDDIEMFGKKVLNGEVYKKNTLIPESTINLITDVTMLTQMAATDKAVEGSKFLSAANAPIPNISGIIYVNNTDIINEKTIRELSEAYPNLTMFFNNVDPIYSAKFILPDLDEKTGEYLHTYSYVPFKEDNMEGLSVQKIESGWFSNPYKLYDPRKPNHDFYGWSTTPDETGYISEEEWSSQVLTDSKDYVFYAIFTITSYHVEYFVGKELIYDEYIPYGTMLKDPGLVPYYTDNDLADDEKYRFLGYTQNENQLIVSSEAAAKTLNLATMMSVQDYKFYATFMKTSVYNSPLEDKYFTFIENAAVNISRGYHIAPASGVSFSGKITLPTTYNGQPIVGIRNFNKQNDITHVYWSGEPQVEIIGANCFANLNNLEVVQLPKSLKIIDGKAFQNCINLKPVDLSHLTSLQTIGEYCFNGAIKSDSTVPYFKIPGSVTTISGYAFSWMYAGFDTFAFGGPGEPSQLTNVGSSMIRYGEAYPINNIIFYGLTQDFVDGLESSGKIMAAKDISRVDA